GERHGVHRERGDVLVRLGAGPQPDHVEPHVVPSQRTGLELRGRVVAPLDEIGHGTALPSPPGDAPNSSAARAAVGWARRRPAPPYPSPAKSGCAVGADVRAAGVGTLPVSSAATRAAADGNRLAGSFSSINMTARARSSGTSARRCCTGIGRSEMCLTSIAG